jgi:hypothetical protein
MKYKYTYVYLAVHFQVGKQQATDRKNNTGDGNKKFQEVIDRKRFRPSTRPKIIGRIFGRNEYLASAAENEKSLV